ncbi:MAG TPA: sigma 54-interacting transcriptional regulator [Myxococcales bacterium]|nr:sigma 54-interacting transcriptional regulator [Myxococcales bacterium]
MAVLASDEPLADRLERWERPAAPDAASRIQRVEYAMAAALAGNRVQAEQTLLCIRSASPAPSEQSLAAAWAFVLVEIGEAARAAAHAHSAVELAGERDPVQASVARLLLAQAIAGQGRFEAALDLASRVLEALPPGRTGPGLRSYAALTVASLSLNLGNVTAAKRAVGIAAAARAAGLLGARGDVMQARVAVASGADRAEASADLKRALQRLATLGARRDMGLALLFRATAQLEGKPGAAVAQAHRLLTGTRGAADLTQIRAASNQAVWSLREPDPPWERISERLQIHRRRVHETLVEACEAQDSSKGGAAHPCSRLETVDDLAALVAHAEQQPGLPLARCLVDRARVGQLVAAAQALSALHDPRQVMAAIPRIALSVCAGASAQVVRASRCGAVEAVAGYGPPFQLADNEVIREVAVALGFVADAGGERAERPCAALALREAGDDLALLVAAATPGSGLARADLERLTVFASLAASTLARTRADAELRETAARDAATLGAIADGLLAVGDDGIIRSANHAAANAVGMRREDLVGRRLRQVPALAPLALVLDRMHTQLVDVIELARGEFVVHAYAYDGGVIVSIREASTERQIAKRVIGSVPRFTFDDLVGRDPAFMEAMADARRAATTELPVLIGGESGTGKELLAQAIHNASPRASSPFLAINVTAIPRDLLETELFGYEGGAFTGARTGGQAGKFEVVGRGTIVLDEIGDMPPEMQCKLLRVLQERTVQRVGGSKDIPVRARVIATTHRDLDALVREGKFRLDLFHRLRVVHLTLPPLRTRPGDVRRIAEDHLQKHAARTGVRVRLGPAVLKALEAHQWPGNVRELVNLLEWELGLLPAGAAEMTEVPRGLARAGASPCAANEVLPLTELERRGCEAALRHFGGNVSRAAKALGVSRATLYAKMKLYDIQMPQPGSGT